MRRLKNSDTIRDSSFDSDDCSGVYVTTRRIDLNEYNSLPKRTVVFIKDKFDDTVEFSTVSSQTVKFVLDKSTAKKWVVPSESASTSFHKCFDNNRELQDKHEGVVKSYKLKENILMAILIFTEVYSIIQMINSFNSGNITKIITSVILVVISAALLTGTIMLRRKEKSLWFTKQIEYSKFMADNKSRENFDIMTRELLEMGFNIYESEKG